MKVRLEPFMIKQAWLEVQDYYTRIVSNLAFPSRYVIVPVKVLETVVTTTKQLIDF